MARILGLLLVGLMPLDGQVDNHLWLVRNAGVLMQNTVFVLSPEGQLLQQFPGPVGGMRGVVKMLDGTVAIADFATSGIYFYNANAGLLNGVMTPNIMGIAGTSAGNIAVLTGYAGNPLATGMVRMFDTATFTWSTTTLNTAAGPTVMRGAAGGIVWVLCPGSNRITRIQGNSVQSLNLVSTSAFGPLHLAVLPDGRAVVSSISSTQVALVPTSGGNITLQNVGVVPHRLVADGDVSLWVMSAAGVVRRLRADTFALISTFTLPPGSYTGMHLCADGSLLFEESMQSLALRFSAEGVLLSTTALGAPTTTSNDPTGMELAGLVMRGVDADGDGVSSAEECARNSNPLDATNHPPLLAVAVTPTGPAVTVTATGCGGMSVLLLANLAGASALSLGVGAGGTAPWWDLELDNLALQLVGAPQSLANIFSGFGWGVLDINGQLSAAIAVPWWLPPGTVALGLAAAVVTPTGGIITSSVTLQTL